MASYDRAVALDPGDADALSERGDAHERNGQYDRAIEDYSLLIALQPANPKAWNNRCWYVPSPGNFNLRQPDCNEALLLCPATPTPSTAAGSRI